MKTTEVPPGPTAAKWFLATSLTIFLCLAGAACGQRGPLFLPPQEPAAGSTPPSEATPDDQATREPAEEADDEPTDRAPGAGKDDDEETS